MTAYPTPPPFGKYEVVETKPSTNFKLSPEQANKLKRYKKNLANARKNKKSKRISSSRA